MKVILCIPTITKPYQVCLDSVKNSVPVLDKAGIEHGMVSEVGCPYISAARSMMLRKALDAKADQVIFIDHDLSWDAEDLLTLIETEGDVVAGTYRFKKDEEEYMGQMLSNNDGTPIILEDGTISAYCVPAGFLKITTKGISRFIEAYPELLYGERHSPHIDLFNHGAHKFTWYGEDYAFSRNWIDLGGIIKVIPNLNLNHHTKDSVYKGNFHEFLMKQSGGSNDPNRKEIS